MLGLLMQNTPPPLHCNTAGPRLSINLSSGKHFWTLHRMVGRYFAMNKKDKSLQATLILIILVYPFCAIAAEGVDGASVLQGLNVSSKEIANLERGEILIMDSRPYESTARDLAADAAVLIDVELNEVMSHFESNINFVPNKEMLAYAGIEYTADDIEEIERLLSAKRGKTFNFSDEEYAQIKNELAGLKNAQQFEKTLNQNGLYKSCLQVFPAFLII